MKAATIFTALATCLLASCATTPPATVQVVGDVVVIKGVISQSTASAFKQAIAHGGIRRVQIASGGGDVAYSIEIAKEMRQQGMDVEVIGNCFSSCANYIFPAGLSKTIMESGVVAWHGNVSHLVYLHDAGERPQNSLFVPEMRRLAKLETEFLSSIGVDAFLCWFAKIGPYRVENLYFLSVDDMARFGVTNVKARADYEKTDVSAYNRNGRVVLEFVKVDWENLRRPTDPR